MQSAVTVAGEARLQTRALVLRSDTMQGGWETLCAKEETLRCCHEEFPDVKEAVVCSDARSGCKTAQALLGVCNFKKTTGRRSVMKTHWARFARGVFFARSCPTQSLLHNQRTCVSAHGALVDKIGWM